MSEWFNKHVDTAIVLTAIFSSFLWMGGKFTDISDRFSALEKDVAVIKTVLVMKGVMPSELAKKEIVKDPS